LPSFALDDQSGRKSCWLRAEPVRQSMTTRLAMPVASSSASDHRLAFDQILEADRALDLGEDRPRVGIPLGQALAARDLVALVDLEARAVLHAVHACSVVPS